ncbi:MAG: hypothetical protein WC833_00295 [Bacteroidales bacterium]|jgi:hypothetical protein
MVSISNFSYRKLIILIAGIILFKNVYATGQAADYLIIEKDTVFLFANPLEPYLNYKNERKINGIELTMTSTGCWRGYVASWELKNDSLFLIKLMREKDSGEYITFNLKEEFGSDKVFAEWYTGTLYCPRGERLQYVHMGYGSIYEKEEYYKVWNGVIKSKNTINNLVYNKDQLYPAEKFLHETIKSVIISKIDSHLLKETPDSVYCLINIRFNENGKVENVKISISNDKSSQFEQAILKIAEEEVKKLPALMKVTHKNYGPPSLGLLFNSKMIKKELLL